MLWKSVFSRIDISRYSFQGKGVFKGVKGQGLRFGRWSVVWGGLGLDTNRGGLARGGWAPELFLPIRLLHLVTAYAHDKTRQDKTRQDNKSSNHLNSHD